MLVADYVLSRLADEGIDTAFYLYGGAIAPLMDAVARQQRIRAVGVHHEQAAGFMAEGYAKASGKPGLAFVTSGPGGGNIITALQNAYYDSTPLIVVSGQVSSKFMRPSPELRQLGFQETPIVEIARPITKLCYQLHEPEQIGRVMDHLLRECRGGRPGPVLLDLPIDVQRREVGAGPFVVHARPPGIAGADASGYLFMADLQTAKRPGILVGGGAYRARHNICAFAASHNIPVFRTWNALDVVTDDHPCYGGTVGTYGGPGRNFGVQNTDLLLVLGCRLSGRITGGMPETFARGAKMYLVDVDPALLHPRLQQRQAEVNVLADCGEFINALA